MRNVLFLNVLCVWLLHCYLRYEFCAYLERASGLITFKCSFVSLKSWLMWSSKTLSCCWSCHNWQYIEVWKHSKHVSRASKFIVRCFEVQSIPKRKIDVPKHLFYVFLTLYYTMWSDKTERGNVVIVALFTKHRQTNNLEGFFYI